VYKKQKAEGPACADPGARTPIGVIGILSELTTIITELFVEQI
jgi:hypothetical protein